MSKLEYKIVNGEKIFDLNEFIDLKKDIVEKYSDILTLKMGNTSEEIKLFSDTLDKYILHVVEECIEFRVELRNALADEDKIDEAIMELVDVIEYLASIQYIFEKNINHNSIPYNLNRFSNEIKLSNLTPTSFDKLNNYKTDELLMDVINDLIIIRRKFPERKWHKLSNRILTEIEVSKISFKFSNIIRLQIIKLIKYLNLILKENNIDTSFIELLESKHIKSINESE